MKKEKQISFKITEEVYNCLKSSAKKENKTVSEYIRIRLNEDVSKKWIKKETVQQCLSHIGCVLDKYEEGNMRMAGLIRDEVLKLWNKL